MSRLTNKNIIDKLFSQSARLKPDKYYSKLSEEFKNELGELIRKARKTKPVNVSPEERLRHFVTSIPSDIIEKIDLATANRFSKTRKNSVFLSDRFKRTVPAPGFGRKATQGEIDGQKAIQEERKSRSEATNRDLERLGQNTELEKLGRDTELEALGKATEAKMMSVKDISKDSDGRKSKQRAGRIAEARKRAIAIANRLRGISSPDREAGLTISDTVGDSGDRPQLAVTEIQEEKQRNKRPRDVSDSVLFDEFSKSKKKRDDKRERMQASQDFSSDLARIENDRVRLRPEIAKIPEIPIRPALQQPQNIADVKSRQQIIPVASQPSTPDEKKDAFSIFNPSMGNFGPAISSSITDRFGGGVPISSDRSLVENIKDIAIKHAKNAAKDQFTELINNLIPQAAEALELLKNPQYLPVVAFDFLKDQGVFDRLLSQAENFSGRLIDRIAGTRQPTFRPISSLPKVVSGRDGFQIGFTPDSIAPPPVSSTGSYVVPYQNSSDNFAAAELADNTLISEVNDNQNRPQNSLIQAGRNLIKRGVDTAKDSVGTALSDLAEQATLSIGQNVLENIPGSSLKDSAQNQLAKFGKDIGSAVKSRVIGSDQESKDETKDSAGDPVLESKNTPFTSRQLIDPTSTSVIRQADQTQKPVRTIVKTNPPKRAIGRSRIGSRNKQRLQPNEIQFEEKENDGGDENDQMDTAINDPIVRNRIESEQNTVSGILPLRPEFLRSGIDSISFPTNRQIRDKFNEGSSYMPLNDGLGDYKDNPLIKRNLLEEGLRFRYSAPFPRKRKSPGEPSQFQERQVSSVFQRLYNNDSIKFNTITTTPVFLSTEMMNTRYVPVPMIDVDVPARIQNGGLPYTRSGLFSN
jgi:hypothetical protein